MSHAIEFIETSLFTRQLKSLASDDELTALQKELIAMPEKGDLIQHTGGLRKIRMATASQGKRGGARVIYFLATKEVIYFLMAYPKSAKDNLTDAEKAELRKLTARLTSNPLNAVYERCTMYSIKITRHAMRIFDDLKSSLEEAVEIQAGIKSPSRVTRYEVADVRAIREQLNVTQSEMAKALGTSVDTIKSWESRRRNPTGLAAKVLNAIKEDAGFYWVLAGQ